MTDLTDEQIEDLAIAVFTASQGPSPIADKLERIDGIIRAALAAQQPSQGAEPEGWRLVPVEFVRGFSTLAHNYSLTAVPPDYYRGTEGDAFSNAYRRCGQDLAKLRSMLTAAPQPSRQALEPLTEDEAWDLGPGDEATWTYQDVQYFAAKVVGRFCEKNGLELRAPAAQGGGHG